MNYPSFIDIHQPQNAIVTMSSVLARFGHKCLSLPEPQDCLFLFMFNSKIPTCKYFNAGVCESKENVRGISNIHYFYFERQNACSNSSFAKIYADTFLILQAYKIRYS